MLPFSLCFCNSAQEIRVKEVVLKTFILKCHGKVEWPPSVGKMLQQLGQTS